MKPLADVCPDPKKVLELKPERLGQHVLDCLARTLWDFSLRGRIRVHFFPENDWIAEFALGDCAGRRGSHGHAFGLGALGHQRHIHER